MEDQILADLNLSFALEDTLDAQGASNELVIIASRREDKVLAVPEELGANGDTSLSQQLPLIVRETCLRFMSHLAPTMNMGQKQWFEAVVLFDAYCNRKASKMEAEHVPALCIALLRLLRKTDSKLVGSQRIDFSAYASYLAQSLRFLGCEAHECSNGNVATQEQELLKVLGWQINVPTIESWLSLFYARFNVFTNSNFVKSLDWLWRESISKASWLVLRQINCAAVPARRLARGLASIMLASVRLIAIQSLKAPEISATEWFRMFVECCPNVTIPDHVLRPVHDEQPMKILEITMGVDSMSLQQDCKLVAILTKELLRELAQQATSSNSASSDHPHASSQCELRGKDLAPARLYACC